MQIKKLTIDEYGALREREFVLSEGMNILEGNNESGKSTILSFIRFMLYGMPRKSAGTVTDRDRGISWSSGIAGGSMEISVSDKKGNLQDYRIERHGQMRGAAGHENYTEVLKIIDLATGTEVFDGQEPGKALLGLSQETFVSTACLRQLECTNVDGTGINASIENLLFAANEGINTEKALNKLDDIRKTLLHKNGKGGMITELETQKLFLEEKLTHAKETAETIITKESAVEALGILENEIGAKSRECENTILLYENCTVLRRFDELHTKETELEAKQEELRRLCDQKGYPGKLPDRQTVAEIENSLRALSDASANNTLADAELTKAQTSPDGDRILAAHTETIEAEGGREAIEAEFAHLTKKQKKAKRGSLTSLIFGIVLLLGGLFCLVCGLSFTAPLFGLTFLTDVAAAVKNSVVPLLDNSVTVYLIACYSLLGIGALVTVLGILLSVSSKKAKKARTALLGRLALTDADTSVETFAAHIDGCLKNHALCETYDKQVEQAAERAEGCRNILDRQIEKCQAILSTYRIPFESTDPRLLVNALRSAIEHLSDLCREKERLEGEMERLETLALSMSEGLDGYSENALRSAIGLKDPAEVLATTDIEKVETSHRYLKEQLAAAISKRIGIEKELIALTASAENPAKLSAKLEETVTQLEECEFRYQSVMMAMEAIDSASDSLRRSVTPRIREKAGAFMGRITDGKYGELGVTADMTISIFAGNSTRNIDVLSKGTKDAAYLSLRMALADLVSPSEPLTLTMDEGLSLLDEERAARTLSLLHSYTQSGGQCILFTCHKREGQLMKNIGDFRHILLS